MVARTDSDVFSAANFPRAMHAGDGDYCLDGQPAHAYGDHASLPVSTLCDADAAVHEDCALYEGLGLRRFVTIRYADDATGAASVNVRLSQLADADRAFGVVHDAGSRWGRSGRSTRAEADRRDRRGGAGG